MIVKRSVKCKECGKWIDIYVNEGMRKVAAKCKCGNVENIR